MNLNCITCTHFLPATKLCGKALVGKWKESCEGFTCKLEREGNKEILGKELTDKALNQINTVKQDNYGKPEDSFGDIAGRWTQQVKHIMNRFSVSFPPEFRLAPSDVALMMIDLKIARELHKKKEDNIVDGIGYFALYDNLV